MNLHELLAATPCAEILGAVFAYYDGSLTDDTQRGYAAALAELRGLAPERECPGALAMELTDSDHPHDVYLIQPDGTAISASLMSWTGWLAADVPAEVRAAFSDAAILGAVLWELTFYGFSAADVDARAKHIVDSALAAVQAAQAGDVVVARSREDIHKWIAAIATADDEGAELDQ